MQGNGIGPLVSQLVHERNADRAAARGPAEDRPIKPHPHADTVEFSESALARFEALKGKLVGEETPPVEDPGTVADVDPTRDEPAEPVAPEDELEAGFQSLRRPRLSIYV